MPGCTGSELVIPGPPRNTAGQAATDTAGGPPDGAYRAPHPRGRPHREHLTNRVRPGHQRISGTQRGDQVRSVTTEVRVMCQRGGSTGRPPPRRRVRGGHLV